MTTKNIKIPTCAKTRTGKQLRFVRSKSSQFPWCVILYRNKSSFFQTTFNNQTKNNKLLKHVDAKPGDAIIFTEALAHGSMTNKTNKVRRVLSYCYSVGYMPDWTKLKLEYSKEYLKKAPKKIKKLIKLYKD